MKSRFDAEDMYSNNYLRMHGYAMYRRKGKRKKMTLRDMVCVPFVDVYLLRRCRRVREKLKG
mgnify:CR=1 FL=1